MKAILLGDVHVDYFKDVDYHHDIIRNVLLDVTIPYMKENDCRNIIFMGDVFDSRTSPNVKSVSFMVNLLKSILKEHTDFNIHIITGNHDVYHKNTNKITSLDYFGDIDRLHIVKEPTEFGNMLLLPWICSENRDDILQKVQETDMEYCLGHFEFTGFKQSIHDTYLSKANKDSISISEFKKFKKVISGHYHYSSEQGNILYTGSLCQLKKDDKEDRKKIFLLDTSQYTIDVKEHGQDLMVDILIDDNYVPNNYFGKKVFVRVALGISDKVVDDTISNIRLDMPISVNVYDNPNKTKVEADIDFDIKDVKQTIDLIQVYVTNIDNPQIDNDKLYRQLHEYYKKVK